VYPNRGLVREREKVIYSSVYLPDIFARCPAAPAFRCLDIHDKAYILYKTVCYVDQFIESLLAASLCSCKECKNETSCFDCFGIGNYSWSNSSLCSSPRLISNSH